ncbi:tyrosine--tRNA ligase [Cryomorphaceae bacterium]|nr:tyrosine--tRNA ligase [Cryomorphaceae bacterium]
MSAFIEELKWRGMIHDVMPGTDEALDTPGRLGYVGFDPTAESLHIGNLVPIMLLTHFQRAGHCPVALVGGATGMVGDPSGKKAERQLLSEEVLQRNIAGVQAQLQKFLSFEGENAAQIVNNYDWFKDFSLLDFLRDVGKHLTINYMMAKDSVKSRLETGLSFTEFSYQLIQGYDFYHLKKEKDCILQMGGSDQWGNITAGTELIRRMDAGEAYALTCPLITKADGSKFGKSEGGNIWLDPNLTSPYKFYQYWLNAADEDVPKWLRIFSLKGREEIEAIEAQHAQAPHMRLMQIALAEELTIRVHSEEELKKAQAASKILFGKSTQEELVQLDEDTLLSVFEGVPQFDVSRSEFAVNIVDLLAEKTSVFASKGEARRMLKSNAVSLNKEKVQDSYEVGEGDLLNNRYLLVQKGKKNYFLLKVD